METINGINLFIDESYDMRVEGQNLYLHPKYEMTTRMLISAMSGGIWGPREALTGDNIKSHFPSFGIIAQSKPHKLQ